jgi:hypothetical protein
MAPLLTRANDAQRTENVLLATRDASLTWILERQSRPTAQWIQVSADWHNYTGHNMPAQYSGHTPLAAKELKKQTAGRNRDKSLRNLMGTTRNRTRRRTLPWEWSLRSCLGSLSWWNMHYAAKWARERNCYNKHVSWLRYENQHDILCSLLWSF